MSYKCQICRALAPPKTRRLTHRLPSGAEVALCLTCLYELEQGASYEALLQKHAVDQAAPEYTIKRGRVEGTWEEITTELAALQQNAEAIQERKEPKPKKQRRKVVTPNVVGYRQFTTPMSWSSGPRSTRKPK